MRARCPPRSAGGGSSRLIPCEALLAAGHRPQGRAARDRQRPLEGPAAVSLPPHEGVPLTAHLALNLHLARNGRNRPRTHLSSSSLPIRYERKQKRLKRWLALPAIEQNPGLTPAETVGIELMVHHLQPDHRLGTLFP